MKETRIIPRPSRALASLAACGLTVACNVVLFNGYEKDGSGGTGGASTSSATGGSEIGGGETGGAATGGAATGGAATGGGGAGTGGATGCIEGFSEDSVACTYNPNNTLFLVASDLSQQTDLQLELWYGVGAPTPGTPFDFDFFGDNYATCAVCGIMSDDAGATYYLVTSGHLQVTEHGAIGAAFAGTLTNAVFEEITLAGIESTFVPNGKRRCVPWYQFAVAVAPGS